MTNNLIHHMTDSPESSATSRDNPSDNPNRIIESSSPEFKLEVTKDKFAVELICRTEPGDLKVLAKAVLDELVALGIADPPTIDVLEQRLVLANTEIGLRIHEATPPSPPENGRIEWGDNFFDKNYLVDEETGSIDYRRHAAVVSVEKGKLLATLIPPKPGKDGRDVFGKTVHPVKPRKPSIHAGSNVDRGENQYEFYATASGRIRWSHNVLAIDEVYVIPGNIDLETGDIDHPGAVVVKKDILPGSRLEAIGDIEVMGVVEHAHIQTSGSLIVHGGITGAPGQHIVVAGEVRAKFIIDADIQAGESVIVEKEIMHSTVRTRGAIVLPKGRIVGGESLALGGIQVAQAGTVSSAGTVIIAGEDYALEGILLVKQRQVQLIETNLAKITATLSPLLPRIKSLPSAKRSALEKLQIKLEELNTTRTVILEEMEEMKHESRDRAEPCVEIEKVLYPDTCFEIETGSGNARCTIREKHTGPIRVRYINGVVRLMK